MLHTAPFWESVLGAAHGPDGRMDWSRARPKVTPDVAFLTPGLGSATTSMNATQEMHVLRRWAQHRFRVRAVPRGGEALKEPRA